MIKILFNFICSSLSLFLIILRDYTKTKRFCHYIFQLLLVQTNRNHFLYPVLLYLSRISPYNDSIHIDAITHIK